MENELDTFLFQQQPQTPSSISSWFLDQDNSYKQGLEHIENHLFNFEADSFASIPIPDSPFFQDLYNFHPSSPTAQHETINTYNPVPQEEHPQIPAEISDTFLDESDLCFIAPFQSEENIVDHLHDAAINTPYENVDKSQTVINDVEIVNEENEDETDDDPKSGGALNSKNLVSERNRRKRLSQQLLALRALVPNITKMDKRSVLVDALAYLRSIHEETERLQKEMKDHQSPTLSRIRESCTDNPSGNLRIPRTLASTTMSKSKTQITQVEVEKIEDRRFVVKVRCKGGTGVGGDVLRVIESLGFEITCADLQEMKPSQEFLSTLFLRVRKHGKMTEKRLKDSIVKMALKSGFAIQNL